MPPPRLATWLLQRRLAPDERDELIGDLHEQYRIRLATAGPAFATRWYWRQALALAWGFSMHRRDVVSTVHDRRRGHWLLQGLAHDWRDATRGLRHSPGFAAVAVLTIALGIGLSTAVFSVVDGILLQPLPFPDAERLVRLAEFNPDSRLSQLIPSRPGVEASGGTLADTTIGQWLAQREALDAIVPVSDSGQNVVTPTGVEQMLVGTVGGQFFDVLAVRAAAGRVLQPADDRPDAPHVAVVSERALARLVADPVAAVGSTLVIETVPHTVVGVVPAMDFPRAGIDIWRPGRWTWPDPTRPRSFSLALETFGRMRPGVAVDAVQAEGVRVVTGIASAHPGFFDGTVPVPQVRVRRLLDDMVSPVRPALVVLSVGMTLVLLAACVNLANLVLTRTTARQREAAVRRALGASGMRIARPVLFEQLLLATAGSVAGAVIAWWILRALPHIAPADLPRLDQVGFSVWSLVFAFAAALATAGLAGLAPVARLIGPRASRRPEGDGLRARLDRRSADRARHALVVAQVALAGALLVGAALIGRSMMTLLAVDRGYAPEGVLTFQVASPSLTRAQPGRLTQFVTALADRIAGQPGVIAVGTSTLMPTHPGGSAGTFYRLDRPRPTPDEMPAAQSRVVSSGYFAAIGTPVRRGRGFLPTDVADGERVVVIDETAAARHFPGEDPIGIRLRAFGPREWTIVGVVAGVHEQDAVYGAHPTLYFPTTQIPEGLAFGRIGGGFAVRAIGDPLALLPFLREQTRQLEPDWPIFNASLLVDRTAATTAQPRFYAIALGLFALLALSTAVLGVYGVLAYAVERRRLEFSIRRALGATEHEVLRLVLRRGVGLGAAGLVVGLLAAAGGSSLLRSQLYGIDRFDAVSFLASAAMLVVVVLAASWLPARRAMRSDPASALHSD